MRRIPAVLALALALTAACGKSSTGPSTPVLVNGSFTAKVDGANFNAVTAAVSTSGNITSVGASNASGESIGFAWQGTTPGTYSIAQLAPHNGIYIAGSASWVASVVGGSGTITITTQTSSRVAGTFSFTMVPSSGTTASGNKNVTQGSFDLTF